MKNHQRLLNPNTWIIIAIVLIAFNLRPAITGVGPLVGMVRDELQLTSGQAGMITTLPLLAFAGLSIAAPRLAKIWSIEWAILAGLLTLLIGILLRSTGFTVTLFIGMTIIGVGIAICNVLLPGFVKLKFEKHAGLMTSIYTTSMNLFATIASGLSIPLAVNAGLGWQGSLAIWGGIVVIAICIWVPRLRHAQPPAKKDINRQGANLWSSPLAWYVTAFMGLQSLLFYSLITWLPEIVQANGIDLSTAGWLLSFMQLFGLPATFITPIIATRLQNQRLVILFIAFFYLTGMVGLIFVGHSLWLHVLLVFFLGNAQGASISLSFILFNLRTQSAEQASQLSGMAQSIGYLLAAVGPIILGWLFDFTNAWTVPLMILTSFILLLAFAGLSAGKDTYIFSGTPVGKKSSHK
ncbi:CP family cyanate transporter-like MFS transporter [Geomicrobium halophilum]|uniref:CP family cyanate transporter-like MFS transporter n=1 Tax=Geomicrobium halophilum TaxID=549000 RepID=A0A841Q0I4_9BACL|nr:MFS transporter [Geomicrobium halophilum]MBB6451213.1 CP family cyanate transporter-like MFS transporter [Geomicrobium halophilum]